MTEPHWSQIIKDLVTALGLVIGGSWAVWKWGYSEELRKKREMVSPDGTLTATDAVLTEERTVVTLHAVWRNRGDLPISLCPTHSLVEGFKINPSAEIGKLQLGDLCNLTFFAVARPSWSGYIMEPNTDSIMHEHFVVDNASTYAFRWVICLAPGSMPGAHVKEHMVCTRELIWHAKRVPPNKTAAT